MVSDKLATNFIYLYPQFINSPMTVFQIRNIGSEGMSHKHFFR